jgi:hypothetical protein
MNKEDLRGWNLFRDFIQAEYKYERLENFIQMREKQKKDKELKAM